MTAIRLQRRKPAQITAPVAAPPSPEVMDGARAILAELQAGGEPALRRLAGEYDGLPADAPLVLGPADLRAARALLEPSHVALLERTAGRIEAFARAQRAALRDVDVPVPGGRAGHTVVPVDAAGCYAPAGRHPLPSSVLMTAVTARVAGVGAVMVATPSRDPLMLAAAQVAGADGVLCAGGAQAIGALALGIAAPACDVVVGPGNAWVTAAKLLLADRVRTDGAAGPSELVVVADAACDADLVAADLLAQAEHDPDARVALLTWDEGVIEAVEAALAQRLPALPTAAVARASLDRAVAVRARDAHEAADLCDRLAPEHLQWSAREEPPRPLRRHGGLFLGRGAAEVLGDYGFGPNHVLPTGGQARSRGGLSVLDFLAVRTWLRCDAPEEARDAVADAEALARLEGLAGHALAAAARRTDR